MSDSAYTKSDDENRRIRGELDKVQKELEEQVQRNYESLLELATMKKELATSLKEKVDTLNAEIKDTAEWADRALAAEREIEKLKRAHEVVSVQLYETTKERDRTIEQRNDLLDVIAGKKTMVDAERKLARDVLERAVNDKAAYCAEIEKLKRAHEVVSMQLYETSKERNEAREHESNLASTLAELKAELAAAEAQITKDEAVTAAAYEARQNAGKWEARVRAAEAQIAQDATVTRMSNDLKTSAQIWKARAEKAEEEIALVRRCLKAENGEITLEAVNRLESRCEYAEKNRNNLAKDLADQLAGNLALRRKHGAYGDETMAMFIERLVQAVGIAQHERDDTIIEARSQLAVETLHATMSEKMLGELLAVIHRDGGHRTEEVGLKGSVAEAMQIVPNLLCANSERMASLDFVREVLLAADTESTGAAASRVAAQANAAEEVLRTATAALEEERDDYKLEVKRLKAVGPSILISDISRSLQAWCDDGFGDSSAQHLAHVVLHLVDSQSTKKG